MQHDRSAISCTGGLCKFLTQVRRNPLHINICIGASHSNTKIQRVLRHSIPIRVIAIIRVIGSVLIYDNTPCRSTKAVLSRIIYEHIIGVFYLCILHNNDFIQLQ